MIYKRHGWNHRLDQWTHQKAPPPEVGAVVVVVGAVVVVVVVGARVVVVTARVVGGEVVDDPAVVGGAVEFDEVVGAGELREDAAVVEVTSAPEAGEAAADPPMPTTDHLPQMSVTFPFTWPGAVSPENQ